MAPHKKAETIEKSEAVTISPPGLGPRFALLGNRTIQNDIALYDKRGQYGIFYEMYRQHPVLRAAIDRKADMLSAGGFNVVPSDPLTQRTVDSTKAATLKKFFKASQLRKLLRHTYKDLDVYGESYWVIITNLNYQPMKAMRLNPRFMNPVIVMGEVVEWKYGPIMQADTTISYPPELVLHFMLEDPESDVRGLSPLYALQRSVAQDIFSMEYNESFFKNAAQTGTIFIAKTSDAAEAKRAREWIESNYTGTENAHRPLFIEGDVTVEKSVSTRVEMEFLEGRKFLRQEIAMVLEVDLEKLGIHEHSNRAVSKEQNEAYHSESIRPRQVIVEDEINYTLIEGLFGWDDIGIESLEADLRRQSEQIANWDAHQKMGRMSIDDILAEMGEPPLPNGQGSHYTMLTPAGVLTLKQIIAAEKETLNPTVAPAQASPAEPQSGQGTDQFGKRNPPSASMRTPMSPSQAMDSKMGQK